MGTRSMTPVLQSLCSSFLTQARSPAGYAIARCLNDTLGSRVRTRNGYCETSPMSDWRHASADSKGNKSLRNCGHSSYGATPKETPWNRTNLAHLSSGERLGSQMPASCSHASTLDCG